MSRAQRRIDRSAKPRTSGTSRRQPVNIGSGGVPWRLVAIVGIIALVVGVIAYLIIQANSGGGGSGWEAAQADASADIPGVFYPSQGRNHLKGSFVVGHVNKPFCPGAEHSAEAGPASSAATPAAQATAMPAANASATPRTDCFNSNPPSSGDHLNVQRNVDVGGGNLLNFPPDPDIYPPDIEIPRDIIPHILEHAGVFVGYNCADDDNACADAVKTLTNLVNDRIDNRRDRVVMAHDRDLPAGQIALASWTRVDRFNYHDFTKDRAVRFISTNSCRFDPENFCSGSRGM